MTTSTAALTVSVDSVESRSGSQRFERQEIVLEEEEEEEEEQENDETISGVRSSSTLAARRTAFPSLHTFSQQELGMHPA